MNKMDAEQRRCIEEMQNILDFLAFWHLTRLIGLTFDHAADRREYLKARRRMCEISSSEDEQPIWLKTRELLRRYMKEMQ